MWNLKLKTPFTVAPPKMKYLGINLAKHVQDLYEENYNTLVRKPKEMKSYPMFMCRKTQYCQDGSSPQLI